MGCIYLFRVHTYPQRLLPLDGFILQLLLTMGWILAIAQNKMEETQKLQDEATPVILLRQR